MTNAFFFALCLSLFFPSLAASLCIVSLAPSPSAFFLYLSLSPALSLLLSFPPSLSFRPTVFLSFSLLLSSPESSSLHPLHHAFILSSESRRCCRSSTSLGCIRVRPLRSICRAETLKREDAPTLTLAEIMTLHALELGFGILHGSVSLWRDYQDTEVLRLLPESTRNWKVWILLVLGQPLSTQKLAGPEKGAGLPFDVGFLKLRKRRTADVISW